MLKNLRIRNFQSHRDTQLDFHPGVNVIVGESLSGKTSILRAFLWSITDRPRGYRFHSWFTKEGEPTKVSMEYGEGDRLIKAKTKSKTTYHLNGEGFKGGQEVPEPVIKSINVDELNIQTQLDQFFLITSSPQEIGRVVSRVIQLEDTEDWLRQLTSRINNSNREVLSLKEMEKKIELELERYEDLNYLEGLVRKAERLEGRIDDLQLNIEDVEKMEVEARELEGKIFEMDQGVEGQRLLLDEVEDKLGRYREVKSDFEKLQNLQWELDKWQDQLEQEKSRGQELQRALKEEIDKLDRCPLCGTEFSKVGRQLERMMEVL